MTTGFQGFASAPRGDESDFGGPHRALKHHERIRKNWSVDHDDYVRTHRTSERDPNLASRFAREAEPLFDVLSRRARGLTRCEADAEDLLQDALLHAYMGFHTFREGTNLKAWLFRILYNRWVTAHRTKQRRPSEVTIEKVTDSDFACGASRLPAAIRSAEAEVLDGLPDSEIKAALEALPAGFAVAVYYADIAGYTYVETSAILDIPLGTVMSRVSRGRARLRIALAHLDIKQRRGREPRAVHRVKADSVMELAYKTALITGGTAGIGLACARLMSREGASVIITGRDAERGKAAAASIDGSVRFVEADLADIESVRSLVEQAGDIDILVNNAASFPAA